MAIRFSLFTKIIVLLFVLLIPILILYSYSNLVSMHVVKDQIYSSQKNELTLLSNQIGAVVNQISLLSFALLRDSDVQEFQNSLPGEPPYTILLNRNRILGKVNLNSSLIPWSNQVSVYSSQANDKVVSDSYVPDPLETFPNPIPAGWNYRSRTINNKSYTDFVSYLIAPAENSSTLPKNKIIIESSFSIENIQTVLDKYKLGNDGEPFLYHSGFEPLMTRNGDQARVKQLIQSLEQNSLQSIGQLSLKLNNTKYAVTYTRLKEIDWFLINFVPLENILSPIQVSRNWFYSSIALLILMTIGAITLLYKHVQLPIRRLVRGVERLRRGDFTVRIPSGNTNEFDYLITSFNAMVVQIEELINKVYVEKLLVREAQLKQLQSQINPHFLYNCLSFIINMTKLREDQAVIAMARHLSKYYRYTTRVEKEAASLQEELELVTHYLNIQNLRMKRIKFEIHQDEAMIDQQIPRLTLQPIVENAIIHGLEPNRIAGLIIISCRRTDKMNYIEIDNNGIGLTEDALNQLNVKLHQPLSDEMGCGLWNVHQRLILHFGMDAGISFQHSPLGGIKAIIQWKQY